VEWSQRLFCGVKQNLNWIFLLCAPRLCQVKVSLSTLPLRTPKFPPPSFKIPTPLTKFEQSEFSLGKSTCEQWNVEGLF
jgi:hypothetical protein